MEKKSVRMLHSHAGLDMIRRDMHVLYVFMETHILISDPPPTTTTTTKVRVELIFTSGDLVIHLHPSVPAITFH